MAFAIGEPLLAQTENSSIAFNVGLAAGKIVKGYFCGLNYVFSYERRAFPRTLLGTLDAAFPFENGPAGVTGLGK